MSEDFDFEPIPGLPAPLPAGEKLLWQGSPRWTTLAVRAFHVRKAAIYFAVMVAWRFLHLLSGEGASPLVALRGTLAPLGLALAGLGLLGLLAWLSARGAVFSITTRRVLIRHGIALPMTLNVPFRQIDSADVHRHRDGSGDIAVTPAAGERVGYLLNWPYVRPARYARPQPMLRAIADVETAAAILAEALAASCAASAPRTAAPGTSNATPARPRQALTA